VVNVGPTKSQIRICYAIVIRYRPRVIRVSATNIDRKRWGAKCLATNRPSSRTLAGGRRDTCYRFHRGRSFHRDVCVSGREVRRRARWRESKSSPTLNAERTTWCPFSESLSLARYAVRLKTPLSFTTSGRLRGNSTIISPPRRRPLPRIVPIADDAPVHG